MPPRFTCRMVPVRSTSRRMVSTSPASRMPCPGRDWYSARCASALSTDSNETVISGGAPMRYSSCSQSLVALASSTSTTKVTLSGCPQPTTTWPCTSRSSMRYSSMGTAALRLHDGRQHRHRAAATFECMFTGGDAVVRTERPAQQDGEIHTGDDDHSREVARNAPRRDRAAPGWKVGEDHLRLVRTDGRAQELLDRDRAEIAAAHGAKGVALSADLLHRGDHARRVVAVSGDHRAPDDRRTGSATRHHPAGTGRGPPSSASSPSAAR